MSKQLNCVLEGCTFTAIEATEEEILEKTADHALKDHGMKEITPELAAKVKSAIRDR